MLDNPNYKPYSLLLGVCSVPWMKSRTLPLAVTIGDAGAPSASAEESGMKAPHHRGTYHRRSRALVAAAYADTTTKCWRCGRTMEQIHQAKPRAKWTAGHLVDGQVDGALAPECSPCNYGAGARLRHRTRTDLTW